MVDDNEAAGRRSIRDRALMRYCVCLNGQFAGQSALVDVRQEYWSLERVVDTPGEPMLRRELYKVFPLLDGDSCWPFSYVLATPETTPEEGTRLYLEMVERQKRLRSEP